MDKFLKNLGGGGDNNNKKKTNNKKDAGGWNITYPNYQWYIDDAHMRHYIDTEIKLADMFVNNTDNKWSHFTEEWLTENFGTHPIKLPDNKYSDTEVCLISTDF